VRAYKAKLDEARKVLPYVMQPSHIRGYRAFAGIFCPGCDRPGRLSASQSAGRNAPGAALVRLGDCGAKAVRGEKDFATRACLARQDRVPVAGADPDPPGHILF
jgi:hypothetical protein